MDVVRATSRAAEIKVFDTEVAEKMPRKVPSTTVQEFPVNEDQAREATSRILEEINPSAVICVEKVGPTRKEFIIQFTAVTFQIRLQRSIILLRKLMTAEY